MQLTDEQIIDRLGQRMKEMRKDKGLTQLDIASRCNMDEAGYRRLENGRSSPTLKSLLRICSAFEIDLLELFSFTREV